jgi:hypothetical protein
MVIEIPTGKLLSNVTSIQTVFRMSDSEAKKLFFDYPILIKVDSNNHKDMFRFMQLMINLSEEDFILIVKKNPEILALKVNLYSDPAYEDCGFYQLYEKIPSNFNRGLGKTCIPFLNSDEK